MASITPDTVHQPTCISKLNIWDKLVLFVFALMLFDSTGGFDTGLNTLLIVKTAWANLRPQEILIILAVLYIFVNPRSLAVLTNTSIGCLLLVFFSVVAIWTCIRLCEGETTNMMIRMYLGWIAVPVALCVVLRKWESVAISFYMVIVAGLIGVFIMGVTTILGFGTMRTFFPGISQRAPEAYSAHFGFFGNSYAWIPILTYYATANMLLTKGKKQHLTWAVFLICLLGLDIITMGRGRLAFNIFFLLFGLTFIAPVLGIHFQARVKAMMVLLMLILAVVPIISFSSMFDTFKSSLKMRFSTGAMEISTKSGSFAAHYLAPFERLKLLRQDSAATLLLGAGPIKNSEIFEFYAGDVAESTHLNDLRSITGDSSYATLLGWYGLLGLSLMLATGIVCFRKYLRTTVLDVKLRYVGAIGSVAFILGGILVASSDSALEADALIIVWAVAAEYHALKGQEAPQLLKQPIF